MFTKSKALSKTISVASSRVCMADLKCISYHVPDARLEVTKKGSALVSLHLSVLDGFPSQEVVHLYRKDGRWAALILGAGVTCQTRATDMLHANHVLFLLLHANCTQSITDCVWGILSVWAQWVRRSICESSRSPITADTYSQETLFDFLSHRVIQQHRCNSTGLCNTLPGIRLT